MRRVVNHAMGWLVVTAVPMGVGALVDAFTSMPRLGPVPVGAALGFIAGTATYVWGLSLKKKYERS